MTLCRFIGEMVLWKREETDESREEHKTALFITVGLDNDGSRGGTSRSGRQQTAVYAVTHSAMGDGCWQRNGGVTPRQFASRVRACVPCSDEHLGLQQCTVI